MEPGDDRMVAEITQYITLAKAQIGDGGSFRLRVLLDMILLELTKLKRDGSHVPRQDS